MFERQGLAWPTGAASREATPDAESPTRSSHGAPGAMLERQALAWPTGAASREATPDAESPTRSSHGKTGAKVPGDAPAAQAGEHAPRRPRARSVRWSQQTHLHTAPAATCVGHDGQPAPVVEVRVFWSDYVISHYHIVLPPPGSMDIYIFCAWVRAPAAAREYSEYSACLRVRTGSREPA